MRMKEWKGDEKGSMKYFSFLDLSNIKTMEYEMFRG